MVPIILFCGRGADEDDPLAEGRHETLLFEIHPFELGHFSVAVRVSQEHIGDRRSLPVAPSNGAVVSPLKDGGEFLTLLWGAIQKTF